MQRNALKRRRKEKVYYAKHALEAIRFSFEHKAPLPSLLIYYAMARRLAMRQAHHEKAVLYFQRALKLNRRFLAAWTLMGHEYMEMKNTGAAVEAYRRGVDVNPRDYRAWSPPTHTRARTRELVQTLAFGLHACVPACMRSRLKCAEATLKKKKEDDAAATACCDTARGI